jgi:hypothetical protein
MSDAPYIIAAYSVSWVVLTSYAIYLVLRGMHARRASGANSGVSDA